MRTKKLIKSSGGMTLIEVVIALVLFSIISVGATAILVPTLAAYRNANDLSEVTVLANDVAAGVINSLEQATENAVLTPSAVPAVFDEISIKIGSKTVNYRVVNGLLQAKAESNQPGSPAGATFINVFDERYYRRKKVAVTYEVVYDDPTLSTGPTYTVRVKVSNSKDSLMFEGVYTCRPLLLNQY